MPRRRTIFCDHCGFLQLKRDIECEGCQRLTRRGRRQVVAWSLQLGAILVVGLLIYWKTQGVTA